MADERAHRPGHRTLTAAPAALGLLGLALLTALLAGGAAGLIVAVSALAALTAIGVAIAVPGADPGRRRQRPPRPRGDESFRAYHQVGEQLSWAAVSPRHYDLVTRPLLTRLAAARLAELHRVDLHADPGRAAQLLGPEVWPWVDPRREPASDSQPPGVGRDVLSRIIDRLERL